MMNENYKYQQSFAVAVFVIINADWVSYIVLDWTKRLLTSDSNDFVKMLAK